MQNENEVALYDIVKIIWQRKAIIILLLMAGLLSGILYLHITAFEYTATLQVTPITSEPNKLSQRFLGIASLAGINLTNGSEAVPFELYLNGFQSREIAEKLTTKDDLVHKMFAGSWDEQTGKWRKPGKIRTTVKSIAKLILGIPERQWAPPNAADIHNYLIKHIAISKDRNSPVVTISVKNSNADFAKQLLWQVHVITDEYLRQNTLQRSTQYIAYLSQKLKEISVAEHRQALIESISQQEKLRMMASSSLPFVAEPFGPPYASLRPTTPDPLLILILTSISGLFIGILMALFWNRGLASFSK